MGTAKDILDEAESGSPVSLLGRLGARIEGIARSNRSAVARLLQTLDVQMAALHNYRPPGFAFWHILGSVLFAALVVSLLLLSGAVRGWGITEMDSWTRNILFGALTLAAVSGLILLRSYGVQALSEGANTGGERLSKLGAGPTWLGALGGAVVAALFVGLAITFLDYPSTEPATYPGPGRDRHRCRPGPGLFAGRLSRTICPVWAGSPSDHSHGAGLCLAHGHGGHRHPNGWYATVPGDELRSLLWPVCRPTRRGCSSSSSSFPGAGSRRTAGVALVWTVDPSVGRAGCDAAFTADRVADAAREQFLGLSAVLSRLIWYPFGKGGALPEPGIDLVDFEVSKAEVCQFGLSPSRGKLFETRTVRLASERGWLTSSTKGRSTPSAPSRRFWSVPTTPRRWADPIRTRNRWPSSRRRLARRRGTGGVGPTCSSTGCTTRPFSKHWRPTGKRRCSARSWPMPPISSRYGGHARGRSLVDFMAEVSPRGDGEVDPRYFDPEHLATGSFERTWHHRTWWPQEELFDGGAHDDDGSIEPIGSLARGRRSGWPLVPT